MEDQYDVWVVCKRGGSEIARYHLPVSRTADGAPLRYDREKLIDDAKSNLTDEGKAGPPYDDIEFEIIEP